jgi:outer membrane immunogenic protein
MRQKKVRAVAAIAPSKRGDVLKGLMLGAALAASVAGAGAAHAADLMVMDEPVAVAAAAGDWEGFYIGAFAGYGLGRMTDVNEDYPLDGGFDLDGYAAGIVVGADWAVGNGIVVGVAADAAWTDLGGIYEDYIIGPPYNDFTADVSWTASLRGRIGFDQGSFLPYLTAGVAAAGVEVADYLASGEQTHIGFTIGAGVEMLLADSVSLDLQYRYSDFGSKDYALDSGIEAGISQHALTAGLNFRF